MPAATIRGCDLPGIKLFAAPAGLPPAKLF